MPCYTIPSGVQLRELRLIYGPAEAGRRLDMMLGLQEPVRAPAPALPAPEPAISDEIIKGTIDRALRQVDREIFALGPLMKRGRDVENIA